MQILELTLLTNNLPETEKFYGEIIGFKKADKTENNISFYIGTSKIIFELSENVQNPHYHFALNIPSNKIEEAAIWLSKRTKLIISEDNNKITTFEKWNAKAIYFFDNNHNIVELICRTDLNNSTNTDFFVESILNINEIGLVNDEPLKIGQEIIAKTNIDYFEKGPKREDFVAIGNENGLFVISNPNRNWFPTTEKAEKHKVKVKINVGDQDFLLEFK